MLQHPAVMLPTTLLLSLLRDRQLHRFFLKTVVLLGTGVGVFNNTQEHKIKFMLFLIVKSALASQRLNKRVVTTFREL